MKRYNLKIQILTQQDYQVRVMDITILKQRDEITNENKLNTEQKHAGDQLL
jgi:hypothetical protein